MAKKATSTGKGGKNKKYGRNKRKAVRKGSPISLFVRGRISAQDYWKLINMGGPTKR